MYLTLHLLHTDHYSSANFMTNKYSTVMELIKESTDVLKAMQLIFPDFNADKDCPMWLKQEYDYISSL